jgi:RNA polymerase sigma factor (TIGR02999 family)
MPRETASTRPARDVSDPHQQTVSRLLHQLNAGDRRAFDALLPLVYGELRVLAERQRRRWEGDDTLNATALVHEAYLRLVDQSRPEWSNRAHFLAVAATAMRQVLLDYAKRRQADKREGRRQRIPLEELENGLRGGEGAADVRPEAILALDESLERLARHDARKSRIVECRFFGGMSIEDTAEALGMSPATVKRGWAMARAWLYRDLAETLEGAS